jgi:hypothetical protein
MARDEKLRARVKSRPSDLKWDELARFLAALGYEEKKGAGSRRKFRGEGLPAISLHKPHPANIVKQWVVNYVVEMLVGENLL